MPQNGQRISVVLPAYNEEKNIERAVRSAAGVLETIDPDYEIIVVNDASTDNTKNILDRLAAENPRVKPCHLQQNTRFAGALRKGFSLATKDLVFYTDSDNPIDMADIAKALPLLSNSDVVTGFRKVRGEGFKRNLYTWGYNSFIRMLFGLKVRDVNFAFKLIRREALKEMDLRSTGSFIDAEILLEATKHGRNIAEIGIDYFPRTAGESTLANLDIIPKIVFEALKYRFTRFRDRSDKKGARSFSALSNENPSREKADR